jgi:hypothetical protein
MRLSWIGKGHRLSCALRAQALQNVYLLLMFSEFVEENRARVVSERKECSSTGVGLQAPRATCHESMDSELDQGTCGPIEYLSHG